MRIVITGASGNLGSALVRRSGATPRPRRHLAPRTGEQRANIEWVTRRPHEDNAVPLLRDAFAGAAAVVHLAWGFQPSHDLAYLEELGVGGTRRVLEAATAVRPAPRAHVLAGRLLAATGRPSGRRVLGEGRRADVAVSQHKRPPSGCSTATSRPTPT